MSTTPPLFTIDAEALTALKVALVDLHKAVFAIPLHARRPQQAQAVIEARTRMQLALRQSSALWPMPVDCGG